MLLETKRQVFKILIFATCVVSSRLLTQFVFYFYQAAAEAGKLRASV